MEVYERIKARRKELGLSADDLAEALGVSRATIYRYESAYIEKVPVSALDPLSKVLRCSPSYIMGWGSDEPAAVPARDDSPDARERDLLSVFRRLDERGKRTVENAAQAALLEVTEIEERDSLDSA